MPALRRGQWYDTDTKMFEALFTLLCEYVENECAHMELMDTKKYSRWTRLRHRWLPRKFRKTLSRKLGLANLDWAINEPDCQQHQRDTAEMTKDLCLIEAALATDKIVISLDDNTARKFFSEASVKIDELKDIVWVNPDKVDEEQPIEWLRNGALKISSVIFLRNFVAGCS
jgi:hypothetical protein